MGYANCCRYGAPNVEASRRWIRSIAICGITGCGPIIDVPIDDRVTLVQVDGSTATPTETNGGNTNVVPLPPPPPLTEAKVTESDPEVRMKVSWLPSASRHVEKISPDADLTLAQSKMLRHDYSQLAVQSGERSDPRAISWESIAKARLANRDAITRDAIEPGSWVDLNDALLPLIPTIIDKGYVFVRDRDRTLKGIITTADLSKQFEEFANPFLMLGEIERGLSLDPPIGFC